MKLQGRLRVKLAQTGNDKYIKLIGEFNDHCYAKLKLTDSQGRRAFQNIIDSEFVLKTQIEFYEHRIQLLEKRIKTLEEGKEKHEKR